MSQESTLKIKSNRTKPVTITEIYNKINPLAENKKPLRATKKTTRKTTEGHQMWIFYPIIHLKMGLDIK